MQKFSELKLCHAFFHSNEGGTKARNLLKYAWKGPWKEVPLHHFSFPGFSLPFTFASYRNNFFSQYRSHATMLMPTGLPVVTLGPFWGSSIDTNTCVGLSNVKSWWCCAVTSDLLPWTECPSCIFPQSHNPEVYFQHSASCAYFSFPHFAPSFLWNPESWSSDEANPVSRTTSWGPSKSVRLIKLFWPERESLLLHI